MARLFISHSSKDNVPALAFQRWLGANGWSSDDVFIDLHGIGAGERWRDTLRKANAACEAVILLASPEALASVECQKELELAEALGKEIIVAILRNLEKDAAGLARYSERQFVDLAAEPRERMEPFEHEGRIHRVEFNLEALARIKSRLDELGIAPGSFAWPPKDRPNAEPYPGLLAFGEDDAGIFFGREADIMAALTEIRLVRRRRQPRLIVVQAASGAGKSSFLRAGLWSRLKRDPDFAPLAILRPAQGIVSGPDGLGQRIAPYFERHGRVRAPGSIQTSILNGDVESGRRALATLLADATELATAARRAAAPEARAPAPLLAIDQAEELFAAENAYESNIFLDVLSPLMKAPEGIDPYVLLTIRSDSVQSLLDRVAALGLDTPKPIYLPPLARESYREVILRPAEVYTARVRRLAIDPALVQAVVDEAKGADALPLLAFTLGQLYANYRQTGELTRAHYDELGGAAGSIRRALAIAQARVGQAGNNEALRRLIVPQLATWDPSADQGKGAAKRVVARLAKVLDGERMVLAPLANALVEQRLLTRGADTLEVAHEALLRQPPIEGWLAEDREFLMWRDRLAYARAQYEGNVRGLLVGRELQVARDWLAVRPDEDIAVEDREFVTLSLEEDDRRRSEEQERERQRQEAELEVSRQRERAAAAAAAASRRIAQRTAVGIAASIVLAVFAGWQWSLARDKAIVAEEQRQEALVQSKQAALAKDQAKVGEARAQRGQSLYLSSLAREDYDQADLVRSMLRAVEAMPDEARGVQRPLVREAEEALARSYYQVVTQRGLTGHTNSVTAMSLLPDGKRALTASLDGTARLWDLATQLPVMRLVGHFGGIIAAVVSDDGRWIVTGSSDGTARIWDAASGQTVQILAGHPGGVSALALSPDGGRLLTGSSDFALRIFDTANGALLRTLALGGPPENSISFSSDSRKGVLSLVLSPDGKMVFSEIERAGWKAWDIETGEAVAWGETNDLRVLAWSPSRSRAVVKSAPALSQGNLEVWDARSLTRVAKLEKSGTNMLGDEAAIFSPDGKLVAVRGGSYSGAAIAIYDAASGRRVTLLADSTKDYGSLFFSPDSNRIYAGGSFLSDNVMPVWSTATGSKIGETKALENAEHPAMLPDGRIAYVSSGQIKVVALDQPIAPQPSSYSTKTLILEPASQVVISAIEKGPTVAWNFATQAALGMLRENASDPGAILFSRDGSLVAVGGEDLRLFRLNPFGKIAERRLSAGLIGFSADAKRLLVTRSRSNAVLSFSDERGIALDTDRHTIGLSILAISKQGDRMFSGDYRSTEGQLWDLGSGRHVATITAQESISDAVFDASGGHLTILTSQGSATSYDPRTGEKIRDLAVKANSVTSMAEVALLVIRTGGDADVLRIVDTSTGAVKSTLPLPEKSKLLALTSDGRRGAVQVAGTVRVLDLVAAKEITRFDLELPAASEGDDAPTPATTAVEELSALQLSEDGHRILTVAKGDARIWDALTGRSISRLEQDPDAGKVYEYGTTYQLNRTGSHVLISTDFGQSHRLLDATTGEIVKNLGAAGRRWFIGSGDRLLLADENRLALWNIGGANPATELHKGDGWAKWIRSPDDRLIAVVTETRLVIYDTATGRSKAAIEGDFGRDTALAFGPDSSRLAIETNDKGRVLDVAKAAVVGSFTQMPNSDVLRLLLGGAVLSIRNGSELLMLETDRLDQVGIIPLSEGGGRVAVFNPKAPSVIVAGQGKGAAIWRLDPLQRQHTLAHGSTVSAIAFVQDGQIAVTGGQDGRTVAWNASTGEIIRELNLGSAVSKIEVDNDGVTLVIGTGSQRTSWRTDTWVHVTDAAAEDGQQESSSAVSADGKMTAYFTGGDRLRIADTATKETLLSIQIKPGNLGGGSSVSYSSGAPSFGRVRMSNDRHTALSTSQGTVWPMLWTSQQYVDFAKTSLPRCLTIEERRSLYLDPEPPAWCIELSKWPYNTPSWRQWLADQRAGRPTAIPTD